MDSNENSLKELSGKELKRTIITMIKHFKEDKNNRNEINMFMQQLNIFKKTQSEIILEVKNSIRQLKTSPKSQTNRIDYFKTRDSRMEEKQRNWITH